MTANPALAKSYCNPDSLQLDAQGTLMTRTNSTNSNFPSKFSVEFNGCQESRLDTLPTLSIWPMILSDLPAIASLGMSWSELV
jgi:hypothetical protein